jgi:hypothetical protein
MQTMTSYLLNARYHRKEIKRHIEIFSNSIKQIGIKIKKDIQLLEEKIKANYDNSTTNELWLTLKEDLIKTITANIPQNKTKNTK